MKNRYVSFHCLWLEFKFIQLETRIFFSFSTAILEFSRNSKSVCPRMYIPSNILYTFYSIARTYVCAHVHTCSSLVYETMGNNRKWTVGSWLAVFFFRTLSITQRRFHHENRAGLCAAQFAQQSRGRRCLISNQRSLTLHRSSLVRANLIARVGRNH